jgi:LysR family transcriptional regulator, nitrogen assimilation regulatory protein
MVELQLTQKGLQPNVRLEANTLPLITDLVVQGLGYTVLPASGVFPLVGEGSVSASPVEGLRITWTVARPTNRPLSVAGKLFLEVVFRTVQGMVEDGSWALAEIERDCSEAARKSRPGFVDDLSGTPKMLRAGEKAP